MKYFRIVMFLFFAIALYASVDCLIDGERAAEHNGARFGVFLCVVGLALTAVDPDKLL